MVQRNGDSETYAESLILNFTYTYVATQRFWKFSVLAPWQSVL